MSDFGRLSDYVIGGAIKKLSAVECDQNTSNQHELNGTKALQKFMGAGRSEYSCIYMRLSDHDDRSETQRGTMTWYDARERHPTRTEFRFYYQSNPAIRMASEGDTLAVILKKDRTLLFISAPSGSQSELELLELFSTDGAGSFEVLEETVCSSDLGATKRMILESLGIEIEAKYGESYLSRIEKQFGCLEFPSTTLFSKLAREIAGSDPAEFGDLDAALMAWWDTEEAMFKQLESAQIEARLVSGFKDVEDFLSFSQTIRQRRFSRAGKALENHLASIFDSRGITYAWEKVTELRKKPDFIFPSIEDYRNKDFPSTKLTMLGVKTTCKDRWRQVLNEAERISAKHLFTLQPKISEHQTDEMKSENLQLVVPSQIQASYTDSQQSWLLSLSDFVEVTSKKQQLAI